MQWSIRRQSIIGLTTVASLMAGIGGWGAWASLAGAVIAHGQVQVISFSQIIQHPDGGAVATINVRDGDLVGAGDALVVLDDEALRSEQRVVSSQLSELRARAARLKAERDGHLNVTYPPDLLASAENDAPVAEILAGQTSLFEARLTTMSDTKRSYDEQKSQIADEIGGQEGQMAALEEQVGLLIGEIAKAEQLLAVGLTEEPRVLSLKREKARLIGLKSEMRAAIASNKGRIAQLDAEVVRLVATRREESVTELRDVESRVTELDERGRAIRTKLSRLVLAAPMAGIVHDLRIHTIGAVIRPADPVLAIVPQDQEMTVLAKIDTYHIDSLYLRQDAVLKFSAFNARTTPELAGLVSRISPDIKTDERSGAQYYLVELKMRPGEETKLADQPLIPGMPVEVFIQTGERSPLSYAFRPFLDYFDQAFRE
jgi:HlyD family secretion protein